MRARTAALALATSWVMLACGDDAGSGPSVDLSGSWTYSATINQPPETCRVESALMRIEQDGDLIAGTIDMDTLECGGTPCGDAALDGVEIRFGRAQAGGVEFEAFAFDHEGTVSAARMEGDLVTERAEISGCVQEGGGTGTDIIESGHTGTWQATR